MSGLISLTLGERILYQSHDVSNFLKSWIVFKTYALCDGFMRARILSGGYKPWRIAGLISPFSFHRQFNAIPVAQFPMVLQEEEWKCFLDRWCSLTLFHDDFEVVDSGNMGLGILVKRDIEIQELSAQLHGFLEFVDVVTFHSLIASRYNSLYQYEDEDGDRFYCVLFGPLSLVNSNQNVSVGFYNTDELGRDLFWKMHFCSYLIEETVYVENGDAMHVSHRYNSFQYSEGSGDDDDNFLLESPTQYGFIDQEGAIPIQKYCIFYRVSFYSTSSSVNELFYVTGEEVFIKYTIM